MWFLTWGSLDVQDRKETRIAWKLALEKFLKGGLLSRPRGPIEATINVLLSIGWQPAHPDYWVTERVDGKATQWASLNKSGFTRFQIMTKATFDAQNIVWKNAAAHAYGEGLESGIPSFEPARRATRFLRSKGFHLAAQGLETALVGIYRPNDERRRWNDRNLQALC